MSNKFRANRSQIKPKSARKKRKYALSEEFSLPQLKTLKEKIFEQRPMLAEIIEKYKGQSLYDLAKANCYESQLIVPQARKDEFLSVFSEEITRLLGAEIAEKATAQLRKYYFLTTADHQGPLGNARFLTSNLLAAMPFFEDHDPVLTCQIVLACANISFDNASRPRVLTYHIPTTTDILESSLGFFGRTVDSRPVVHFRPYTAESMTEMKRRLEVLDENATLPAERKNQLIEIINTIYNQPSALSLSTFSDQMTVTNFSLWKQYFRSEAITAPHFISLEQERMVNLLLLKHMQQDTLLHKTLFDPTFHTILETHLNGILGAFTLEEKAGTFLFWALPPGEKYRQQLWRTDGKLVTEDGAFSVTLKPEAIAQAIHQKTLIPSTALIFITLCFYYGIRAIGSFNQTTYLTNMKRGFAAAVREYTGNDEVTFPIPTKDLAFARPILAFLKHANGLTIPASGLDIIMYGNETTWQDMIKSAKNIPLEQALYRAFPGLYTAYYPKEEQQQQLLAITEQDIEKLTQLNKKLFTISVI